MVMFVLLVTVEHFSFNLVLSHILQMNVTIHTCFNVKNNELETFGCKL